MKGVKKHTLYVLDGRTAVGVAVVAVEERMSTSMLWHHRLGHISHKGLEVLSKQELLLGY